MSQCEDINIINIVAITIAIIITIINIIDIININFIIAITIAIFIINIASITVIITTTISINIRSIDSKDRMPFPLTFLSLNTALLALACSTCGFAFLSPAYPPHREQILHKEMTTAARHQSLDDRE